MAGPVALVGSGEFLPAMDVVDRELLDGRPRRAVFLPTAAAQEGEERISYWLDLATRHYERLGVEPVPLRVLDRRDADDPGLARELEGAGLIYLSGGNPGYLAATLRDTRMELAMREAWEGGAAIAGCSAGAAALTALVHDVKTEGFPRGDGLALVPHLVILAHFDRLEEWFPGIVQRVVAETPDGASLVGVDEETAIVGGPERWGVRGRGAAWLIGRDGSRHRFGSGDDLDLPLPAAAV